MLCVRRFIRNQNKERRESDENLIRALCALCGDGSPVGEPASVPGYLSDRIHFYYIHLLVNAQS